MSNALSPSGWLIALLAASHPNTATAGEQAVTLCVAAFSAVGLNGKQKTATRAAIEETLTRLGVGGCGARPRAELKSRCLDSPACVREKVASLAAQGVLVVRIARVGASVRVTTRAFRTDTGEELIKLSKSSSARGFPETAPLRATLEQIAGLFAPAPAAGSAAAADATVRSPGSPAKTADTWGTPVAAVTAVTPTTADPEPPASSLLVPAIVAIVGGTLLASSGGGLAYTQSQVLDDPSASRAGKDEALRAGRIGLGMLAVGLLSGAVGGILFAVD